MKNALELKKMGKKWVSQSKSEKVILPKEDKNYLASKDIFEKKPRKPRTLKKDLIDGIDKKKLIKGDPESKHKSEDQIETEVENFLNMVPNCAWWNTKNKGEVHSIAGGKIIRKAGANKGLQDITACIRGLFVAIEVKACNRYQSHYQVLQQEKVQIKGGGFYFIVTSVRELAVLMTHCGILKEAKNNLEIAV